jgi:rubrerythrin
MSDIKEDLLKIAKKIELTIGELYEFFALKIPEDKEFWKKMAWEEKGHANLIDKFAKEYEQQSAKMDSDKSFLIRAIKSLNDITEYIKKNQTEKITRKAAFEKAMQYEQLTLDIFFHQFFAKLPTDTNSQILKMLQDQDKKHLESLKQYNKK